MPTLMEKETGNELLSSKQIRYLRGLGHHLSAKVIIGREGISDNLIAAAEAVLAADELIKVKILSSAGADRHQAAAALAGHSGSLVVQVLGNTILLYRPNSEKSGAKRIHLP
jgi:RNA-binding protein